MLALAVYALLLWIAGTVGTSLLGLSERRFHRGGPYKREKAGVVLRLPWAVLWGAGSVLINGGCGLFFGIAAMWIASMVGLGTPPMILAGGSALTVVISWLLSSNRRGRAGACRIIQACAPTVGYRIFWAGLLLLTACVIAGVSLGQGDGFVDWNPLVNEPFFMRGV